MPAIAQSDSLATAHEKINKLEAKLVEQSAQLNKISSDVNKILKQNLALKNNLFLTPTIANAKVHDDIEYRVLEVTGDPTAKEVHVVISVANTGNIDKTLLYWKLEIIDELGHGYNEKTRQNLKIDGISDSVLRDSFEHHPNTPLTMDLYIKGYNPKSQYIKYIGMDVVNGTNHSPLKFENLPIKWIERN